MRIKKRFHHYLLLLSFLICLGRCQRKEAANTKELQFLLKLDKTNYNLGDKISVNMSIRNNTNREILICAWPSVEKMYFTHYLNGKENTTLAKSIFKKPTETKESFIILSPQKNVFWLSSELDNEYLYKPGNWRLKIIDEIRFAGKNLGVEAWTGILESNTVELSIVNK